LPIVYSWTEHVEMNVHSIDRTENVTVHYIAYCVQLD